VTASRDEARRRGRLGSNCTVFHSCCAHWEKEWKTIILQLVGASLDLPIYPRAFALHSAWVSGREDREPLKAVRDLEQAKAAAHIAVCYLKKPFESPELSALPKALRDNAPALVDGDRPPSSRPNW
jgi:Nucleotidyltransferase